ncbi:MAG: substrate-binding domain-containing protein [Aerococcus sp.]|nr:substrate-binding domain-containing protein [Aerococcus sp.]
MKKQNITIYDVAREAGVSMATVSRVVNGNTNVKPVTRDKVMEVIKRLDYHPNAVARGLASKKTRSVGVLIPDITNTYYAGLAQGINDIASMYKYNIVLATSESTEESRLGVLSNILSRQVDGLVYIGETVDERIAKEVRRVGTSMVLTNVYDSSDEFMRVQINSRQAFYDVTKHLVEEGRQRIAFVGTETAVNHPQSERFSGYKQAIDEAEGLSVISYTVDKLDYASGYAIGETLYADGIDACVVIDDELAVGILNATQDSHVSVPDDFSLITANNTRLTRMVRPQISSIEPPVYDIGAVAMRALTKMMDSNDEDEVIETINLPYEITYRETTK